MSRLFLSALMCVLCSAAVGGERTILVLGDSLSTGYGMNLDRGWVSLLQERLETEGYRYRVVNASISGDTTSGARSRLAALLENAPEIGVVELGGNDGLRGIPLDELKSNLDDIIHRLRASGSRVVLLPMKLPPNYGPVYTRGFEQVYRELAARHGVTIGNFMLEDVALDRELMQEDGIHPRVEAQPIIMERVWALLEPMLQSP